MAKNKLKQFAEVASFPNCHFMSYEESLRGFHLKGKWHQEVFKNNNPIVLELGCGKGEYTLGLAQRYPDKNFIGVDIKGNRIWRGAKTALEEKLSNVAFLRTRIDQIDAAFDTNEVSEIWITFPDPQPQKTRENKRLTGPRFLNRYKKFLTSGGLVHLKTDSEPFYDYSLEVAQEMKCKVLLHTNNLYAQTNRDEFGEHFEPLTSIKTYYENKFTALGFSICYLRFQLFE